MAAGAQQAAGAPALARSRDSAEVIGAQLRARILSGEIEAGSELVQVQVARDFRVSRGPVREAFRLLQREGMIEAEVNLRARVAALSLEEVEHLYALRVVDEALALGVSVTRFTAGELDEMDHLVSAISRSEPADFVAWEEQHQSFHTLLVSHAGARMCQALSQLADHTERYRRVYVSDKTGGWAQGAHEHGELALACRTGDGRTATTLLARHLSRAALTLIATMEPTYDPVLLRAAIAQVTAAAQRDVPTVQGIERDRSRSRPGRRMPGDPGPS